MAISLKHNLKVKKGNIHPGTFYVNKTHIYSILVIVQGVKHGMKRMEGDPVLPRNLDLLPKYLNNLVFWFPSSKLLLKSLAN